ncbi:MAG: RNA polymerase sigma factor [Bacteroidales bacterium]
MDKLDHIILGCQKNQRQSQAELYKMFSSRMYAVCLRYTSSRDDAQDVLQEGFVKIFENIANFKAQGSFEGWMKRIFVNLALDKFRSRISMLSLDEFTEEEAHNQPSALDNMSEKEILEVVRQLPDQYRLVFNLYVMEGHSHQEIASMLGISESTSRSNLARAKLILKNKLQFNASWIEKAI